jgi:hypothetical protein
LRKFIVSSVEGSEGSLTTGSLAVETLNFVLMGFGVPTEAELKAETTEAQVNRVTNLSSSVAKVVFINFLDNISY